jgi:predicted AlkP superfamily phosphohydrolase/phosphomutase
MKILRDALSRSADIPVRSSSKTRNRFTSFYGQECSRSLRSRLNRYVLFGSCLAADKNVRAPLACLILGFLLSASIAMGADRSARHVLVIGCDGFGAVGFTPSNTPVLHKLMREGAYTLHARGVMPTSSSPNWASMIMGAGPEQHGVTSNDWETNKFEIPPTAVGSGGIFPTIFGLLRKQKPDSKIACVHDWDGFGRLIEPRVPDLLENVKGSPSTAARAIEVIKQQKPTFMFIHFDDVDHAGHTYEWKSPEYYQAVEMVDGLIGQVLNALTEAGIRRETVVFMTADHGGVGKSHGGPTIVELEIPWIINGPGVVPGHEIKTFVNTYDLAPTIAWIFGLRTPVCWIGKPVLEAFGRK